MGKASGLKKKRKQARANILRDGSANPFRKSKYMAGCLSAHQELVKMLDTIDRKDTAAFIVSIETLASQGFDPFALRVMMPAHGEEASEQIDLIHYASWLDAREIAVWLMRAGLAAKRREAMEALDELVNVVNNGGALANKEKCADLLRKIIPPRDIKDAEDLQDSGAYQGSFIQGAAKEILMAQASAFIAEHERREINSAVDSIAAQANLKAREPARL